MKRRIMMAALATLLLTAPVSAQNYKNSRYYNPRSGQLNYSQGPVRESRPAIRNGGYGYDYGLKNTYIGLRIGPSFSHVSSDDPMLDSSSWKTGLNVGVAVGTKIAYSAPLYLESGLYYTEKGGEGNGGSIGGKFTYDLNYIELPLVFKYKAPVTNDICIEPYFGGYFAVGVGGKIKDYGNREAYNSFSSNRYDSGTFQRCDGGLRMGVGASYRLNRDVELYMEVGYDCGLTNICHDTFDKSKNGTLQVNFGVNL